MFFYTIGAILLLAAFNSWTSRINQFFFFGRTVSEDFRLTESARKIVRCYLLQTWLCILPALLCLLALRGWKIGAAAFSTLLLQAVLHNVVYACAHARTGKALGSATPIPESVREAPLRNTEEQPFMKLLLWPFLCAILLFVAALVDMSFTSGLAAAPSALMNRADQYGGAYLLGFSFGLLICLPIMLLIRVSSRTRTPMARHIFYSFLAMLWGACIPLFIALGSALTEIRIPHQTSKNIVVVFLLLALALLLWRTFKTRNFVPHIAERNGDEHWRWGIFYANSSDPAIFVQSRCAVGYSLNFARVTAWGCTLLFMSWIIFTFITLAHN